MAEVAYQNVSRVYGGSRAVDHLNLEVADGEFLVLVGPSGSGKSTALRMLAGLETVDEGAVLIGGTDVSSLPPRERDIAMVFQSYALYPHMTVADNMGFALKLRGVPKADIERHVNHVAGLLDLQNYLSRKPKALSGGQRQRVAMGRAIVREPSVFLMDEPLSNLDAKLRVETRANIAALQQRLGTTTIYVTHDQTEAMTMGDRVAVLKDGALQQCATPQELYENPANAFVAGFIGSPAMTLFRATVEGGVANLDSLHVPIPQRHAGLGEVTIGIRPESLDLSSSDADGFRLEVELVEALGADAYVYGRPHFSSTQTDGALDAPSRMTVRVDGRNPPTRGSTVHVSVRDLGELHFFHPQSGERLLSP